MNTLYDWDWNRLKDPRPEELAVLDRGALLAERSYHEVLLSEGDLDEECRLPYLEELAASARIVLRVLMFEYFERHQVSENMRTDSGCPEPETLRELRKKPSGGISSEVYLRLRGRAVKIVMPPCRYPDVYAEICHDIKSIMQKMIAADKRAQKEAKAKAEVQLLVPFSPTHRETQVLKKEKEARASDVLAHGTSHGEFYLPGVVAKNPYQPYGKGKRRNVVRRRKPQHIPLHEQLPGIFA